MMRIENLTYCFPCRRWIANTRAHEMCARIALDKRIEDHEGKIRARAEYKRAKPTKAKKRKRGVL